MQSLCQRLISPFLNFSPIFLLLLLSLYLLSVCLLNRPLQLIIVNAVMCEVGVIHNYETLMLMKDNTIPIIKLSLLYFQFILFTAFYWDGMKG